MNYRKRNFKNKKIILGVSLSVFLAILAVGGGYVTYSKLKATVSDDKATSLNKDTPSFVFNNYKSIGWYTGGNNWPDINDFTGDQVSADELPIADISIHQCKEAGECNGSEDMIGGRCFVMLALKARSADPNVALAEKINSNNKSGDITMKEVGIKTLSINTPEGDKSYDLHQYDYITKNSSPIMRGNSIGFVALSNSHIEVQAVCEEAGQLDQTLSVLDSVRLKK